MSVRRLFDRAVLAAERRSWIRGRLGRIDGEDAVTIAVPSRAGFVFVRLGTEGTGDLTIARNAGSVAHRPHLPVKMREEQGALVIYGVDTDTAQIEVGAGTENNFGLPVHHHRLGSGLEYEHPALLFEPGRVRWAGDAMTVRINGFRFFDGAGWQTFTGDDVDLAGAVPGDAGKWRWVVVGVDPATKTGVTVAGTPVDDTDPLPGTALDALDLGTMIPCAAIRVKSADTVMSDYTRYFDAHGWFGQGRDVAWDDVSGKPETFPPSAHAETHQHGGDDEIATATPWSHAIPKADETGKLDPGWLPMPEMDLTDLQDVNAPVPNDGDILRFNDGAGEWQPVEPPVPDVGDLGDVVLTDPETGDVLTYMSGTWRNEPSAGGGADELNDLSDVAIVSPSTGQVLVYDGVGDWVNDDLPSATLPDGTPTEVRRQGGSSTGWATPGSSNYTPVDVQIQAGTITFSLENSDVVRTTTVTFPEAFAYAPLVFVTAGNFNEHQTVPTLGEVTASTAAVGVSVAGGGAWSGGTVTITVNWLAIGPRVV